MPVEQLAREASAPAGPARARRVDRDDRRPGEPLGERLDAACASVVSAGSSAARSAGRGTSPAGQRRQLDAQRLEPVAQAQVRDAVVAVVALDPLEDVVLGPLPLAELEPLLEGDDARSGVAQVDLALEPVERLHLLDRVALDRRAERLADGAVEVHEHASAESWSTSSSRVP